MACGDNNEGVGPFLNFLKLGFGELNKIAQTYPHLRSEN